MAESKKQLTSNSKEVSCFFTGYESISFLI